MKRFRFYLLLVCIGLMISCSEKPEKDTALVQMVDIPSAVGSGLPFLFSDGEQTFLSWVEKKNDSLAILKYSELLKDTWQPAKEVLRGTDWFVNWADFPVIAENNGNLFTHILKKSSAGTYSYDVKYNLLSKGEEAWKTNLPLHDDGTPTEHGFVTALPYGEGFFVNWLDGRNTVEDEAGNRGAMTLRAAVVSTAGIISSEALLDARTCDCCQTTAAITANGPVVIYRDRSEEEIRDISIVRLAKGEWTPPKTVYKDSWKINGCPVNGPKVAALENTLALAWFTAPKDSAEVRLAFSDDGGASFNAPIQIAGTKAMGRVDVVLLNKDTALVSWMETADKGAQIRVVKVSRSGTKAQHLTIAEIAASRAAGFPQMELVGDKVYFAWTDLMDKSKKVKCAFVKVDRL